MNIFQLYFANSVKLTVKQQSAQRALHAFVITLISSAIGESYVLVSQKEPTSILVGTILVIVSMLATALSSLHPFLQDQGLSEPTITKIEQDIEILSTVLKDVVAAQQKDQQQ